MAKGSANAVTLPNLSGSAGQAQGLNTGLGANNLYPGLTPEYANLAQTQANVNNPMNAQALGGAQAGANIGGSAASGAAGAGSALTGYSQQLLPYATSILNSGFDPQNALYNREFQQNTEQERAAETARGIAMTPYGAGLEDLSNQNFNINWENQQLQREATAAGAAGGLVNTAGGAANTGFNLGQGASSLAASSGALPMDTYNKQLQTGMGALDSLGSFGAQGAAIPQQEINNIMSYLGLGPGYSQAQSQSNDAQNPLMALSPILGQILGGAAGNPSLGALGGK